MNRLFLHVSRLLPVFGLVANRLRFPRLKCGLRVEVEGNGQFVYGSAVEVGEGTRVGAADRSTVALGDGIRISRNVHIASSSDTELRIGAGTTIQDDCRIYGDVSIGRRCILAPNIFISSGTHIFDAKPFLPIQIQEGLAPPQHGPIRIFDDCWLGVNTVISRGVTVGRGSVVGANAVVTKEVPPYSVVAGNPANVVRQRLVFAPKSKIEADADSDLPYFYDGFEYSSQPRGWLEAPDKAFVIALNKDSAAGVRLRLSGEGQIRFGKQAVAISAKPEVAEFNFAEPMSECFLTFSADVPCRVYGAELF